MTGDRSDERHAGVFARIHPCTRLDGNVIRVSDADDHVLRVICPHYEGPVQRCRLPSLGQVDAVCLLHRPETKA